MIFIDMDGVLFDWEGSALKLFGFKPDDYMEGVPIAEQRCLGRLLEDDVLERVGIRAGNGQFDRDGLVDEHAFGEF